MPESAQDVKRWWLVIEDGEHTYSADIAISGKERLMNKEPEAKKQLLGERFDTAARELREWFLANA